MNKMKFTLMTAFVAGLSLFGMQAHAQSNPCPWTVNIQVTEPNCFGSCDGSILVTPSVNWPGFEYLWGDGSTSNVLNNVCAEEYLVTVTDDKKCSSSFVVIVNGPTQVAVACSTVENETYPGAADGVLEAFASGGSGSYQYEWQTNPVQYGATATGLTAGSYSVIVYDGKNCTATTTCDIKSDKKSCDGFRTQTQGGWGQCQQNGNNPGSYLFANFVGAFPTGLTIGCTNTLTLTSAQAVCEFLPSTTGPKLLPAGALTDPGQTVQSVFYGQLVAAMISVGFDLYDAGFSANNDFNLKDLYITTGMFAGWTVEELIEESNKKVGGCYSPYKASELKSALAAINQNYTDGTVDNGFLTCYAASSQSKGTEISNDLRVNVFPNPVTGTSMISIWTEKNEQMTVEAYSISGQKVASLFKGRTIADTYTDVKFDGSDLPKGVYFIKAITSEKVVNHKVMIQ